MALPARTFEAFISYSHAADSRLAAELQRALNRLARPSYKWWQWWPPRVFRDETILRPGDLAAGIKDALLASDSLVLLASPEAAESRWVDDEAKTWLERKPRDRLFIALTDGTLDWDDSRGDFAPERSNALPPALRGAFATEPLWVDFTGVPEDGAMARDPAFLDGAAALAAAIRGVDKDALVGEDARQRRRTRQLVVGTIAVLALLALAATLAAVYAFVPPGNANERARLALSRQYAAESVNALDRDPEQSLVLAARAASTAPTAEADGALRRALRTSRLRSVLGVPAVANDVASSSSLLAAALENGELRLWSERDPAGTLRVPGGPALAVALSEDGRFVLGASEAGAALWSSPAGGAPVATFANEGRVLDAALNADGTRAATAHFDEVVRLWEPRSGRLVDTLRPPGRQAAVVAVAFSPDGTQLAAASGARTAVWDLRRPSIPLVQTHGRDTTAVAFGPGGRRLATGDVDGLVRVWDLATNEAVALVGHEGKVTRLDFSPDGSLLLSASVDGTARIWDVRLRRTLAELRGHDSLVLGAAFDRRGTSIATGGADRTVRLWAVEADPGRARLDAPNELTVRDVAFDRAGRRLATASEDLTARIWDIRSRRALRELRHGASSEDWVESVRFGGGDRIVVTAGDDGDVRVWDARSGQLLRRLGAPDGAAVYDAAVSPDGELVVAGGASTTARIWRWREGRVVRELRTRIERINGVAFSPDGDLVAVAGARQVHVWNVDDAASPPKVIVDRDRDRESELWSLAFDPQSRFVAAGNWSGAATVWDARDGTIVTRVKGHTDTVTDVAFGGGGAYLLTVSWDGVAHVWAVAGGGLVTSVRFGRSLEAAAFAPSGRLAAVAGNGGRTVVFECAECRPLRDLVCLAARRVTPSVRARERDAFSACD